MRPTWHDLQPSPRSGDTIKSGALLLLVGSHNGDFRQVLVEDHLGRPIATGRVPYLALREIQEASRPGAIDTEGGER